MSTAIVEGGKTNEQHGAKTAGICHWIWTPEAGSGSRMTSFRRQSSFQPPTSFRRMSAMPARKPPSQSPSLPGANADASSTASPIAVAPTPLSDTSASVESMPAARGVVGTPAQPPKSVAAVAPETPAIPGDAAEVRAMRSRISGRVYNRDDLPVSCALLQYYPPTLQVTSRGNTTS